MLMHLGGASVWRIDLFFGDCHHLDSPEQHYETFRAGHSRLDQCHIIIYVLYKSLQTLAPSCIEYLYAASAKALV